MESIVVVRFRIPGFHPGDPGWNPGNGNSFVLFALLLEWTTMLGLRMMTRILFINITSNYTLHLMKFTDHMWKKQNFNVIFILDSKNPYFLFHILFSSFTITHSTIYKGEEEHSTKIWLKKIINTPTLTFIIGTLAKKFHITHSHLFTSL